MKIGAGIDRIGSCAFANCKSLQTVEFEDDRSFTEIGWGAFINCIHLFNISIPLDTKKIETIAFANCSSLRSVKIPGKARVEDQAFLSCTKLNVIEIASTAVLGRSVFATEVKEGGVVSHKFYSGEIRALPANITMANCQEYGLAREAVALVLKNKVSVSREDVVTSYVDSVIPEGYQVRNDTYALIIGNQHYRFVPDVPYAKP